MKKNKVEILLLIVGIIALVTPSNAQENFTGKPVGTFESRRQQYLQYCVANAAKGGRDAVFNEIARVEAGKPIQETMVRSTIAFVYTNRDCIDFSIGGLVRLMYLNKKKHFLPVTLEKEIETCLLDFKYWWNDPRKDTVYRCYHTENHQALCHSDELLAGQLLKDEKFSSGNSGSEHVRHAAELLKRWMENRFRFGFSEWLSNNYYEVELLTLTNLYDFSEDKYLRDRAGLLIDMMLYDMALNNYKGVFGSTHGRAYAKNIKGGRSETTSPIFYLMFGVGNYNSSTCMGAAALATSSYRCPELIEKIATDYTTTIDTKERQSMNVEDAPRFGLDYNSENDLNYFWGMQEFIHPLVVRTSKKVSEKNDVWPYRNYNDYIKRYDEEIKQNGKVMNTHLDRFALSEVNMETYRTKDYMLSCANDYRKGAQGYQQHIWQASLGADADVFTTHPGSLEETTSPSYWGGNAILPRATQYKNVVITIYNIPEKEKYGFSHAYFPKFAFDEIVEEGKWLIARKDDGYIALYSAINLQANWHKDGYLFDYIANGRKNVWVCEMGSKKEYGSFQNFVQKIAAAKISNVSALDIVYQSPSLGEMKFGWDGPLMMNGNAVTTTGYKRFDNSFSRIDFDSKQIKIKYKTKILVLDYAQGKRMVRSK